MKKAFLITLFLAGVFSCLRAQQIEQYTQFMINEFRVNPASAGVENHFNATAVFRNQWVGIQDAPRTYYLGVNGPIIRDNMGIGGYVYSDVLGPTRRNGFQAAYAYHLKLNEILRLSFSLAAGFQQFAIDGGKLDVQNTTDLALSSGFMNQVKPDIGAAIRFAGENFYVGFSAPQVVGGRLQFFSDYPETQNALSRHLFLNGAYTYHINDDIAVEGGGLAKYETESTLDMLDLFARGIYADMVWFGMLYRTAVVSDFAGNSVGLMAGYKFEDNLMIGYSYDLAVGSISSATSGSHEIVLSINFNKRNPKPVVKE